MVFLIVVYDVEVDRVNKVKSLLREYLFWVQNSVFEGEITVSKFEELKWNLKKEIDENADSIIFYIFRAKPAVKKEVVGVEKSDLEEVM